MSQVPGRLASWFKSKHKVFKVDKEYISLKPNFLRKQNPAEFGPPGFPAQDKAAAHPNPWHQGPKRNSEDQRILYLEEKILNWLAMKDKVTTTEMAEFAYATHEELVPGASCNLPVTMLAVNSRHSHFNDSNDSAHTLLGCVFRGSKRTELLCPSVCCLDCL